MPTTDKDNAQDAAWTEDPVTAPEPAPDPPAADGGGYKVEAPGSVLEPDQASTDAAAKQQAEDQAWRDKHPNEPLIRGGNPDVGGEA